VIFYGLPGSGKGTQAKLLEQNFQCSTIATGEIIREKIRNDPSFAKLHSEVNNGHFVDNSTVFRLVFDRLKEPFYEKASLLVFDGVPRTIEQAKKLIPYLLERREVHTVFLDHMTPYMSRERARKRREEALAAHMPLRSDDKEKKVDTRLALYDFHHPTLLQYLETHTKLLKLHVLKSPQHVFEDVKKVIFKV
jgi:adenylate kinase